MRFEVPVQSSDNEVSCICPRCGSPFVEKIAKAESDVPVWQQQPVSAPQPQSQQPTARIQSQAQQQPSQRQNLNNPRQVAVPPNRTNTGPANRSFQRQEIPIVEGHPIAPPPYSAAPIGPEVAKKRGGCCGIKLLLASIIGILIVLLLSGIIKEFLSDSSPVTDEVFEENSYTSADISPSPKPIEKKPVATVPVRVDTLSLSGKIEDAPIRLWLMLNSQTKRVTGILSFDEQERKINVEGKYNGHDLYFNSVGESVTYNFDLFDNGDGEYFGKCVSETEGPYEVYLTNKKNEN